MTFAGSKSVATSLRFLAFFPYFFLSVLFSCVFASPVMGLLGLSPEYYRSLLKSPSESLDSTHKGQTAFDKIVGGSHLASSSSSWRSQSARSRPLGR